MDEEKLGLPLYCEIHQPPENLPDYVSRAMVFVMAEALFTHPEFLTFIEEHKEEVVNVSPIPPKILRIWLDRHPYACCFLGEERYLKLISIELPKVLKFGTNSQPLIENPRGFSQN